MALRPCLFTPRREFIQSFDHNEHAVEVDLAEEWKYQASLGRRAETWYSTYLGTWYYIQVYNIVIEVPIQLQPSQFYPSRRAADALCDCPAST